MSRSYRKHPFTKGNSSSWKWDRTHSNRMYRRFVKRMIHHEKYDEIHNRNEIFWDNWNWSPDYFCYFGDYKNPKCPDLSWYTEWRMKKAGVSYEELCEQMMEEDREKYREWLRK